MNGILINQTPAGLSTNLISQDGVDTTPQLVVKPKENVTITGDIFSATTAGGVGIKVNSNGEVLGAVSSSSTVPNGQSIEAYISTLSINLPATTGLNG